ncbi:MAG: hypothetical protein Q8S33_02325 [Myxococcales bacterium]|nr:hypothetical protein [Myxococcales bacterium]
MTARPRDTFEAAPSAPGFSPILPPTPPTTSPIAPSLAAERETLSQTLAAEYNRPFPPSSQSQRFDGLQARFEQNQAAGRAALEVAQRDPSGAALVQLAVTQVRNEVASGFRWRPHQNEFTQQSNAVIAAITPETIARDGLSQTLSNALEQLRSLSTRSNFRAPNPHRFERAVGGG